MAELVNDRGHTLDVPCPQGFLGATCSQEDYASWRRVAVGLRRTVIDSYLSGAFASQNQRAVSSWLLAWVRRDAPIGPVSLGIAFTRAATQADPDLDLPRNKTLGLSFGFGVDTDAARFPPTAPITLSLTLDPTGLASRTKATKDLVQYIRDGWPFVREAIDQGSIASDKVAGDLEQAATRPAQVVNWIPLAVTGIGILGGITIVAWVISLFVRAQRGQVTVTAPLVDTATAAARLKGR